MRTILLASLLLLAPVPLRAEQSCDGSLRDPARQRDIPVRVRMPDGASGPAPTVLFSHGLGGSVEAGRVFAEAWAKAGHLVIHVQHPGSDMAVWRGPGGASALLRAANARELEARLADMRFVASQVGTALRVGACRLAVGDRERLAAAGHSFGAITVMHLARAGPAAAPPRFRAVIALSPQSPGNRAEWAPAAFGRIAIPVLVATGSRDGSPLARGMPPEAVTAARWAVFEALPPSATGEAHVGLWIEGATHADFSGGSPRQGFRPDPHATSLVAAASLAFLEANLRRATGRPDLGAARAMLKPGDRLATK